MKHLLERKSDSTFEKRLINNHGSIPKHFENKSYLTESYYHKRCLKCDKSIWDSFYVKNIICGTPIRRNIDVSSLEVIMSGTPLAGTLVYYKGDVLCVDEVYNKLYKFECNLSNEDFLAKSIIE